MRCRSAKKLLSRRLEGRLLLPEARDLGAHLAVCADCAQAAARLERSWARLEGGLPPVSAARDDFAAVLGAVAAAGRGRPGWLERLLPAVPARRGVVAALAASIAIGAPAGVTLGRAAFGPASGAAGSPEARALAEGFGLFPFGSPAAGLAAAFGGRTEGRE